MTTTTTEQERLAMPSNVVAEVEARWKSRSTEMDVRPGTKAYLKAQADYFAGAMQALYSMGYVIQPFWAITILCGRDVLEERSEVQS